MFYASGFFFHNKQARKTIPPVPHSPLLLAAFHTISGTIIYLNSFSLFFLPEYYASHSHILQNISSVSVGCGFVRSTAKRGTQVAAIGPLRFHVCERALMCSWNIVANSRLLNKSNDYLAEVKTPNILMRTGGCKIAYKIYACVASQFNFNNTHTHTHTYIYIYKPVSSN